MRVPLARKSSGIDSRERHQRDLIASQWCPAAKAAEHHATHRKKDTPQMRRIFKAAVVAALPVIGIATATAANASVNVVNGTGFVGKGDVQTALGLNNKGLQDLVDAGKINFTSKQATSQAYSQDVEQSGKQSGTQTGTQSASQTGSQTAWRLCQGAARRGGADGSSAS